MHPKAVDRSREELRFGIQVDYLFKALTGGFTVLRISDQNLLLMFFIPKLVTSFCLIPKLDPKSVILQGFFTLGLP